MDWLIGHLIGDFLLQNDWMAQGKKRSALICAIHVSIYTLCVSLCAGWLTDRSDQAAAARVFLWVWIPHYLIDCWNFVAWYMQRAGQSLFLQPPMSPWSRIVVDQVFHLVCLWIFSTWLR